MAGHIYRGRGYPEAHDRQPGGGCGGHQRRQHARCRHRTLVWLATRCHPDIFGPTFFDDLLGDLLERLEAQLPVDGVFLALHGAMVAEGDEDASGTVLFKARELVGAGVPIVASLDLHAQRDRQDDRSQRRAGRVSDLSARRLIRNGRGQHASIAGV